MGIPGTVLALPRRAGLTTRQSSLRPLRAAPHVIHSVGTCTLLAPPAREFEAVASPSEREINGRQPLVMRSQRPRMTHIVRKHHEVIRKIAFTPLAGGSGSQSPVKPTGDSPLKASAGTPLPTEMSASSTSQMRQRHVLLAEGSAPWKF